MPPDWAVECVFGCVGGRDWSGTRPSVRFGSAPVPAGSGDSGVSLFGRGSGGGESAGGDAGGGTVLEGCSSRGGGSFTAHVLTNAQTTVHDTERGAVVHRARGLDKGSGRLGFADAER